MDKHLELKRSKRLALALFLLATALFIAMSVAPRSFSVDWLRAIAEAAMIGALADWFAVVALFRRIPVPLVSRHTDIIANNKHKIADNLALFVREKFFDTESIAQLIRRHDPAHHIAQWLSQPENVAALAKQLVLFAKGMLDFIEDAAIKKFITQAVHRMLDRVDFSQSAGMILESMTNNGRHQTLLNAGLRELSTLLEDEETQQTIAQGIVNWLKTEHSLKEKFLPSEWIGKNGADIAVAAASRLLTDISEQADHPVRIRFHNYVQEFIQRLKEDPDFFSKGEKIKTYIQNDETFNRYLSELWGTLRTWLRNDLEQENSSLRRRIEAAADWVGKELMADENLRRSLNHYIEQSAVNMAPDFAGFLMAHISDTIKQWDTREMAQQIELNIGKDLQYIRINGTLVGGLVGCLLFMIVHARELWQWLL